MLVYLYTYVQRTEMGLLLQKPSLPSLSDLPPAWIPLQPPGTGQGAPPQALAGPELPAGAQRAAGAAPLARSRVSSVTLAGRSGRVFRAPSAGTERPEGIHLSSAPSAPFPRGLLEAGPGCLSSPGRGRVGAWASLEAASGGRGLPGLRRHPAGCKGAPGETHPSAAISGQAAPPATRGAVAPGPLLSRPAGAPRGRPGAWPVARPCPSRRRRRCRCTGRAA